MDFWDLTKLIFRRWPISLPILLLSIGATALTAKTVKPDYVMTSYVQLIPPYSPGNAESPNAALRNPWNSLGLNTLGQAAIYATQDQKFVAQLKAAGHTTNFVLTLTYPDPIITVQVVGPTPTDAITTTGLVAGKLETTARSLQKQYGVQDQNMILTQRLDQGQNVTVSGGKVKRAIVAVAGVGLMLTAGVTILFDVLLRRRARRREQRGHATPESGSGDSWLNGQHGRTIADGKTSNGTSTDHTMVLPWTPAQRSTPVEESAGDALAPDSAVDADVETRRVTVPGRAPAYTGTYRSTITPASADQAQPGAHAEPEPQAVPSDVTVVLKKDWLTG
jgi:hypothetical protein